MNILEPDADFVDVLEAAYAHGLDDRQWAKGVAESLNRTIVEHAGASVHVLEHDPEFEKATATLLYDPNEVDASEPLASGVGAGNPTASHAEERVGSVDGGGLEQFHYPDVLATTQSAVIAKIADASSRKACLDYVETFMHPAGIRDALGLIAHPEPGVAVVCAIWLPRETKLSRKEREIFGRVTLHLESALRLRRRPEAVLAIVSPAGEIVHRTEEAPESDLLTFTARTIERSRLRHERTKPETLDVWTALVEGHASVLEREVDGRRFYVVLENSRAQQKLRALSEREANVVALAARGITGKLLGYALGLSPAAVSKALAAAADKLGLQSRLDIIHLASTLNQSSGLEIDTTRLTLAELDVLYLVRKGFSNFEIAEHRARSERTIANQVTDLLRKTNSDSRRALIAARLR